MLADVKTLLWLQWRLTVSMFRARRLAALARLGRLLLMLLLLITTIPFFVGLGIALGIGVANLSPEGALELLVVVNTGLLFVWLLMPASYNSQLMERFELSRLFVHPVRFSSLVVGSTIISLLSFAGLWTVPIVVGEVIGLAWQSPETLPFILLGALPTFAIMVLGGRLMDDVLDLVASDRRLRGLLIFFMSLPFFLLLLVNYGIQYLGAEPGRFEVVLRTLAIDLPPLEGLGFAETVDVVLTSLGLSRYLLWLPPGWATAGMVLAAAGRWLEGLAFLALSYAFAGGMVWAHGAITRRLMQGAALRIGTERVRTRRRGGRRPGPPLFWTLFDKDWAYLRRSPMTLRVLISTPIVAVAFGVALWQLASVLEAGNPLREAVPFLAAALVIISANLGTSNLTADYFGAVDREGLGTLLVAPIDQRYLFLSANAITLLLALAQSLVLLAFVGILTGSWLVVPWGLLFALCLHYATAPLYNAAAILTPYRASSQLVGSNQGNLGSFLAWIAGTPIPAALFLVPRLLWPAGQLITLPLAVVYAAGLYAASLKPAAWLLRRRAFQVLEAVVDEG
jgi:hypothetical protein